MPTGLKTEPFSFESVTLDRTGALIQRLPGETLQAVELLAPGISLELVAIPKGFFQMGSRDEGGYPDELPIHPVFLQGFWLGKYPLTQAQWQAVMGRLPDCRFHGPDLPVETISWADAQSFCEQPFQAHRAALQPALRSAVGIRLPRRHPHALQPGANHHHQTMPITWACIPTRRPPPASTATAPPRWAPSRPTRGACTKCTAPSGNSARMPGRRITPARRWMAARAPASRADRPPAGRVARGGSWHETPAHCRSAMRLQVAETDRMEFYGLRVLLSAEG